MPDTLNPILYRRLGRNFGKVKVTNRGEAMVAKAVHGLEGEPLLAISHDGEFYRVNCPYCSDTRFRLYVNHMYGQTDAHGRNMRFLLYCFNENCLANSENWEDFTERIEDVSLMTAKVYEGVQVDDEAREVQWPGPCKLLSDLRSNHPARAYLVSRNFDPDRLAQDYSVSYCLDSRFSLARNRIVFPIFDNGKMKGWQCRYVGELDWKGPKRKELPPKYFSCPNSQFRSKCIYGFDEMKRWQTGIIVEGPTDKLRFGSMSGCIFGNSVTPTQRKRFLAVFRKRTGVLLLDPEEQESESTRSLLDIMQVEMPGRFCAVWLPKKTDPGKLDRDFLRQYVKEKAAEQGVKVVYRRV